MSAYINFAVLNTETKKELLLANFTRSSQVYEAFDISEIPWRYEGEAYVELSTVIDLVEKENDEVLNGWKDAIQKAQSYANCNGISFDDFSECQRSIKTYEEEYDECLEVKHLLSFLGNVITTLSFNEDKDKLKVIVYKD